MGSTMTLNPIAWTPASRVQRNGFARFDQWVVLRLNQGGQALIAPLGSGNQPIQSERFWINTEQIAAGGLAHRI